MLKQVEDISKTKKRLTIEIPSDVLEKRIQKELKKAQKEAHLPGFRPGKTPINIIERKFGKAIEADVLENIIPEYFETSIKEANISPVSPPSLAERFDFRRNEPLVLKIDVDVLPQVDDLKYEGIKVQDIPVEVKDEDIDRVLNAYAERMSEFAVSQEPIDPDDLVTFECIVGDKEIKDVSLMVGKSWGYAEDFMTHFIGKKVDDVFEVEVDFSEDKGTPLHGIKGKASIKINSVKKKKIPVIDDELAKDLGFDDLANLKDRVQKSLIQSRTESSEAIKINQIADNLLKNHDFELPETLVQHELNMLVEMEKAKNKDKSEEELRKELYNRAVENVKLFVLIELIGKKEKVEVSKEEMEQSLMKMSRRFNIEPEELLKYIMEKDGNLSKIHYDAFRDKVFRILIDKAQKEVITPEASSNEEQKSST